MPKSPAKPPKFSLRLALVLHCLIALAVVVFANLLAAREPAIRDLTATRNVTLSERSINVLEHVERDLRVVVAVRRDHPLYHRVYDLAAAADQIINDRINLDTIDPVREPDAAAELVDRINARIRDELGDDPAAANAPLYTLEGDKLLVISGEAIEQIDVADMVLEESLPEGGTTSLFRGEQLFISAVLAATQPEPDIVGLVTGLGDPPGGNLGPERLASALPYQNAELVPLDLENATEIPEMVDCLLFYGPQSDLSEHAAGLLLDYWNQRHGGVVIFLEPGTVSNLPHLLAIPRLHGVLPREDRVLRLVTGVGETQVGYSITAPLSLITPWNPEWERLQASSAGLSADALTSRASSLAETSNLTAITLPPQSLSLRLDEDMLRQREGRARLTELLTSPEGFYSESNPLENPPSYAPDQDKTGPVALAAAVDTDPTALERGGRSSRLVVVGNAGLISGETLVQNNFDFALNALAWSMARENVLGIAPKRPELFAFDLTPEVNSRVQLVYLGLLPTMLLAVALLVHQLRRK